MSGDDVVTKTDDIVVKVKKLVDEQYACGRNTVMGDDELDSLVRIADKRLHKLLTIGERR